MRKLNDLQRGRAVGFIQAGWSRSAVARHFGVHCSSIGRLYTQFRRRGIVKDGPRSGRPRATSYREDRLIVSTATRRRFCTATLQNQLNQLQGPLRGPGGRRISGQTIRNRLHASGFRARRPARRPFLTRAHCNRFITSVRRRCLACLNANGGHTNY